MGRKLDWLGGHLGATDNPLGSLLGWGVATAAPWAGGKAGSLLRGAGRGMGALRDRMSRQGNGVDSWDEDDSFSPRKIPSGDSAFGNTEEVIIRLTSIENILRDMSELATEASARDATEVENDEQARESFHRLFEQQEDEPVISMSPTRVEDEEKKTGGLFGALSKFAGLIGPGSKLLLGIAGLAVAALLAKKAWDFFNPDKSVTDAAGEVVSGAARRLGDEPGSPPGDVSGDTGPEAFGAGAMDPFVAGRGALERGVSGPVVGVQGALQGINLLRLGGMGMRAPFQMAGSAGRWTSNTVGNMFRARTSGAPTQPGLPFGETSKPSFRQRLSRFLKLGEKAPGAAKTPGALSRVSGLKIGKLGWLGAGLQGFTAARDVSEGNYGQGLTGTVATGLMFTPNPYAKLLGFALSLGLADYKTQDKSKKNILGLLGVGGDLGMGGIGTGAMSDTMGSWLYRGGSWLSSMMGGGGKEPEAAHGGAVGREHLLQTKLMGAGYSYDQAQGIMKNMREESGFDENAVGDDESAFGIAQWRGDRAENMEAHVEAARRRGMSRFEGQVGFLIEELKDFKLSPTEMPTDFAGAANAVLQDYEKPAQRHVVERRVARGTPAPGRERTPSLFTRDFSGVGAGAWRTPPAPVAAIAGSRTAAAAVGPEEGESLTPMAVVVPQTTNNNYFDNRITNIVRPPLDARNPSADLKALQDIQGTTFAFG